MFKIVDGSVELLKPLFNRIRTTFIIKFLGDVCLEKSSMHLRGRSIKQTMCNLLMFLSEM